MDLSIILLVLGGVTVLYILYVYNSLVTVKVRIKESLSQIDVQLKRRTDLIPNLIETVKGYAKHEKGVLEKVTEARSNLMSAKSAHEKAEANNMLTDTLKSLFAVSENYPDLKASQNFLNLQEELSDTENKVAYSRQFYNSNVMDYNTKLTVFPSNIVGNLFRFNEAEFFEADEKDRKAVKVQF